MSRHLERPHPILLPNLPTFPSRNHARSPSRASPTRARITDDLLSDLSPATTLAAFSSSSEASSKLRSSVEAATPGEREFGIRAATAANKIKEWFNELKAWPWPTEGSAGFETPSSKRRKLLFPQKIGTSRRNPTRDGPPELRHDDPFRDDDGQDELYYGSLRAQDVARYLVRIDEILDDMDDLDVSAIKSHILDLHVPGRSRPTSSASTAPSPAPSFSSYTRMDDFTAVVTATVLQALPFLARLQILMEVWGIRLVVLKQINPLLNALDDAEAAVRSGWQALDVSSAVAGRKQEGNGDGSEPQLLSREAFNTMQQILQQKVTSVGRKLDRMLDCLEGKPDTLPDVWLDRMDLLERKYADWSAIASRKVLEGEWGKQNSSSKKSVEIPVKTQTETTKSLVTDSTIDDNQTSQETVLDDPLDRNGIEERPKKHAASDEGSRLSDDVFTPKNTLLIIPPFDGVREISQTESSEPITPITPSIAVSQAFTSQAEIIFPSTPPSSKSGPIAKASQNQSVGGRGHDVGGSNVGNFHKMKDSEPEPENQSDLASQMDGQSKSVFVKSTPEPQMSVATGVDHGIETKQPPSSPRNHLDTRFKQAEFVESTSASLTTPRTSAHGRNEMTDTGKTFHELSETSRDPSPSPMDFAISTGSSYAASNSSPNANRFPSSQHTRRVLSPIQSSADWFDFEDSKTPTKDALRENPNVSNVLHSKQDGLTTPTPNDKVGAHGKAGPSLEGSDDDEFENKDILDDNGRGIKEDVNSVNEALTPNPKSRPILSFDEASPEGALQPQPAIPKRKSPQLLDSPDFSSPPVTPLEPPMLPNVGVLQAPDLFSPTKGPADQLQQQINEILESLPTRIHFTTETEQRHVSELRIPKKRQGISKTLSTSNLRAHSRSPTPTTPSFTLTPAYGKNNPRPRHQNANPEIKLYHLSRSNGGAPIKLFVRLVGENGERVMVRVGGGWADLGEYLREYAIHHSRRNAPEDQIQIHDSSSRIVSTSSIISARNGRTSPISRSVSSMDGPITRPATSMGNRRTSAQQHERPVTSLAIRKTRDPRKSFGEETRQAQYQSPSTPLPAINRARRGASVSQQETPPSATSTGSRSSSRMSSYGEESFLGMSGPRSKPLELSEENEKWVESMTEKVRQASAEKEKKQQAILGEIGTVGGTKRLFRKN